MTSSLHGSDAILAFAERLRASRSDEPEVQLTLATWVVFRMDPYDLALPVTHVTQILKLGKLTSVPSAPPGVAGVMNLRGQVFPVADCRQLLGQPPLEPTDKTRVMVFVTGTNRVGLIVDEVLGVETVAREQTSELPTTHPLARHAQGAFSLNRSGQLILLDPERILILNTSSLEAT